jgi:hypothetical protein
VFLSSTVSFVVIFEKGPQDFVKNFKIQFSELEAFAESKVFPVGKEGEPSITPRSLSDWVTQIQKNISGEQGNTSPSEQKAGN